MAWCLLIKMKLKKLKAYFKKQLEFAKENLEEAQKEITKYAELLNELETVESMRK